MDIIPLGNKIFVLPDEVVDKTAGGIILTDFTKKRPTTGTIIAVGSEVNRLSCKHCGAIFEVDELKVGDKVVYGVNSPNPIIVNINGEDKEVFQMVRGDFIAFLR